MDINNKIDFWFPNMVGKPYKILKIYNTEDNIFNCISYTLDIYDDWMWTNEKIWPSDIPRNLKLESFIMLYKKYGYIKCDDYNYEKGYTKIVLYCKNNIPTHAAVQHNNKWKSKIGPCIIEHDLEWVCGYSQYEYGDISYIMKRKI